jgi:predicted transcriptional regulator
MVERLQNQVEKEERDMKILRAVIESGPIGIVKLSDRTGLPEHKVRYSLRMLENDGFVEPTPDGATAGEDIEAKVEAVNEGLARLIERLEALPNADIADRVDAE